MRLTHFRSLFAIVAHCDSLSIFVSFWLVAALCSLLQFIMAHCDTPCGSLNLIVPHSGSLWFSLAHCGQLWFTLAPCALLRFNIVHRSSLWLTVAHRSSLGAINAGYGSWWHIMVHCSSLRFIMAH